MSKVSEMSASLKIGAALEHSLPHLPGEARGIVQGMINPASLALIAGTLVVWAGSHFFGVGEIVDILLLGVGAIALGFAVFEGGE